MSVSIGTITSSVDVVGGGGEHDGGEGRGPEFELAQLRVHLAMLDRLEARVRDTDRDD